MLLTQSLPPQFLIPAWSALQLCHALQRAHKSDSVGRRRLRPRRIISAKKANPTSLFDELFPEDKEIQSTRETEKLVKLPAFQWLEELKLRMEPTLERGARGKKQGELHIPAQSSGRMNESRRSHYKQKMDVEAANQRRQASLLVLSCASKTLEESDFFRVSPKGEHIEGWTSGIIKVIAARDSNTLQALGHYFILFSSDAAARAYLDQTIRLHTLARSHSRQSGASNLPPPPGYLEEGQDLQSVLRGFSLVPPHNKLSIRKILRPFRSGMLKMLSDGGPAAIASLRSKAEDVVLVSVEGGYVSPFDLQDAVEDDGKLRNLRWKLAGGQDAIVSLNPDRHDSEEMILRQEESSSTDESQPPEKRPYSPSSRYAISFKDRHEARRFVREWHRRPFPVKREQNPWDEEPPIVNAEILW